MGTLTDYAKNQIGNAVYRNAALGAPATWYVALHLATTLAAGASAGAGTISTVHSIPIGSTVVVGTRQGTPNETFTVTNVAGAGPYTVTLSGTLANPYALGTFVEYTPLDDGSGFREPSAGGYARQAIAFGAPATPGQFRNSGIVTFPAATANHGWVTGYGLDDAVSAGNRWNQIQLDAPTRYNLGDSPTFAVGVGGVNLD